MMSLIICWRNRKIEWMAVWISHVFVDIAEHFRET
jgi:hypothetical protein